MRETLDLHVLGTAGYHGNDFRQTTCFMIPKLGIILDAGTGFYRIRKLMSLVPAGTPLQAFVTHPHLDHLVGLSYTRTVFREQPRDLRVWMNQTHVPSLHELFGDRFFPLDPRGLNLFPHSLCYTNTRGDEWTKSDDFLVRSCEVPHPGTSTAYRFTLLSGKSFAYITDTCARRVRTEFVQGVDTLIHECNFPDSQRERAALTGHSVLSDVLRLAERAKAKKLVLMHFDNFPEMDSGSPIENLVGELPAQLPCEVVLTHDNMVVPI